MKRDVINSSEMTVTQLALEETSLWEIQAGAVLLVVRGMILAKRVPVARTVCSVTINQDMKAILPSEEVETAYQASVLASAGEAFEPLIDESGHGTRRLPTERWRELLLPVPPLDEQVAIGRFLDHADRRIGQYIGAKQKLIRLLEEQKQAIIHRAVTRGLDPAVPLRPSGVPWLGHVPAHWEVRRLFSAFSERVEQGIAKLPLLSVAIRTGVRLATEGEGKQRRMIADRTAYKTTRGGDIVYNIMRMWQGASGISPVDGLVSPAYVVARPRKGIWPQYFALLFKTLAYLQEFDNRSRGIVPDRNRLYWDQFKAIACAIPPSKEQQEIVEVATGLTSSLDQGVSTARREIDLLREYRTRLVADVVTGKLDVRAVAEAIPDIPIGETDTSVESTDELEVDLPDEDEIEEAA